MSGWIAAFAWACVLVRNGFAQQLLSADQPYTITLKAGDCQGFMIGTMAPERGAYVVSVAPAGTTGDCNAADVLQSLPQDPEHFATSAYDGNTTCSDVQTPQPRPDSYGRDRSLKFLSILTPAVQALPYTVCSDTTWTLLKDMELVTRGPLDTFVFFDNTCSSQNGSTTIRVTASRSPDIDPTAYCARLVAQSAGDREIQAITNLAVIGFTVVTLMGIFMLTACCSCWCCCARSGRCAGDGSRACHARCAACVGRCGCGWIMDTAGGMTFYRTSQRQPLLFWAFAAACLTTIQVINLPDFRRSDTLDPDYKDTNDQWGADNVRRVPLVRFITATWRAIVFAVIVFGALPLAFSDPLRDRSFRSKAAVSGVLIVSANFVVALLLADIYRYYHLWPHKAAQVVLQIGVAGTHLMTTFTYACLVHRCRMQRRRRRTQPKLDVAAAAAGGAVATPAVQPAAERPSAPAAAPPETAVLRPPPGAVDGAAQNGAVEVVGAGDGRVATGGAGPVGEATEAGGDGSERPEVPEAGVAGIEVTAQVLPQQMGQAVQTDASGAERATVELETNATGGGGLGGAVAWASAAQLSTASALDSEPVADTEAEDEVGGALPATAEELAQQQEEEAGAARSWAGAAVQAVRKVWDDIREDPRVGFRYSAFMSASLAVAAVTTTSSFLRALSFVKDLSECSRADSECLYRVQRWFYRRLVEGLVRVDLEVLELQAAGVCRTLRDGDVEQLIESRWSTNLATHEVLERCQTERQLQGAQQAQRRHPRWLAEGETPVLLGGAAAVVAAYCISMYTIYHVARAYKRLELKLRAARLAELLWNHRNGAPLAATTGTASDTATCSTPADAPGPAAAHSRSGSGGAAGLMSRMRSRPPTASGSTSTETKSRPTARKARVELGRDILKDYETVSIGQSAYFTGTLVSTCFFQLWLGALVLGAIFVALLHPSFWTLVREYVGWPLSLAVILCWHILSQIFLNKYVTDGKRIRWPFVWLFAYVTLSSAYCVVAVLLGLMRLVQLVLTSILALSRLDSCLFTVLRGRDRGYASFLAMALVLHSFQQCLKETAARERRERPPAKDAAAAAAAPATAAPGDAQQAQQPPPAAQQRWHAAAAWAVAIERAEGS
eukprot:jgi/Ulvmu1/6862/UM031_0067.1